MELKSRRLLPAFGLFIWVLACSDESAPTDGDPTTETRSKLAGSWRAAGTDDDLGDVTVQLTFEEDGRLVIVLVLDTGGQLRFGGSWELAGDRLTLTGAYFQPDGQTQVICEARGDSVLLLRDEAGGSATEYTRI